MAKMVVKATQNNIHDNINETDIIIAGGGLNGLIAGLACAQAGYKTIIAEQQSRSHASNPKKDGRASTIAATSFSLLQSLGLAEKLMPHAQAIRNIRVTQADMLRGVSSFFLHFSSDEFAQYAEKKNITMPQHQGQTSANFGYVIENSILRKVFYEAAQNTENLTILYDSHVSHADNSSPHRALIHVTGKGETSSQYHAALLIACDGRTSPLREHAGIDVMRWDYQQKAIITSIFHQRAHGGNAIEQFQPDGAFAVLPMTEQRSAIVWISKHSKADNLAALDEEQFLLLLKEHLGDWLGDIALASDRQTYPLSFSHAKKYYQHRLLLLGDSAHAIHPLAGQGLNLGLRDSAVLADILTHCKKLGLDIGREENLQAFATQRQQDNHAVSAMTDMLNRLFTNSFPPIRLLRTLGMKAVNHTPPLKQFFAGRAMGIRKNMPNLMQ